MQSVLIVSLLGWFGSVAAGLPDPRTGPPVVRPEEPDEEELPDDAERGTEFVLGADLEYTWESVAEERSSELSFDEVQLGVESRAWRFEAGIRYRSDSRTTLVLEEAALQVGGIEAIPWYLEIGRTVLPFAETDASFVSDPVVTVLGETDEDAVVAGWISERMSVVAGAYRPELSDDDGPEGACTVAARIAAGLRVEFSASTSLGESSELRELYRERIEDAREPDTPAGSNDVSSEPAHDARARRVPGIGGRLVIGDSPASFEVSYLGAAGRFPAGRISESSRRPVAWSAELSTGLAEDWDVALRYEGARDLPDAPRWEVGGACGYRLAESVAAAVEVLYGRVSRGASRVAFGFQLGLEY